MRWHRAIIGTAVLLVLAAAGRDQFDGWVDATVIPPLVIETGTEILDRDGDLLRAYQVDNGRWRLHADVASVDAGYLAMLVAYEDKRFYRHKGVDLIALGRAVGQAVRYQRMVSGASTLTMQTARLLEESGTGRWEGKLRQARLALALERRLSKQEILNLYLQRAPFGGNLEGVRAASLAYFGKEPRRLTPAQSALLVALPQSPESRRPDRRPEAAHAARDRVLERMRNAGVIDPETAETALTEAPTRTRRPFPLQAPHLADRLIADGAATRVETTLDGPLQRSLERLAKQTVRPLDPHLSVAIVVADHQTGEVLASIGSPDFRNETREGFVDMTRALRSPGSTLKPLIYGLGFERGMIHPETIINDRAQSFGNYAPQNFDGEFRGQIRVREALQLSLNLPVIGVLDAIGPSNFSAALRKSGAAVETPGDQPGLAVGLGGLGINLYDVVQLYAGLARGGQSLDLIEVASDPQSSARLMSKRAAWYITDILSGIAPPANARGQEIAYKTGTSYGHRDTLAIGYDGKHVVGVWMGRPDGTPVPGAFGAELAAPVLFQVFERLKSQPDPLPAAPPDALLISNAELPKPLRMFKGTGEVLADPNRPQIAFPPDGARIAAGGGGLYVQIRNGAPPFSWLANGKPVAVKSWDRQMEIAETGRGYLTVTVVDAKGRSTKTDVFVD
ncbi:penicillin-binding protein 1C [uncultured Litoreibacter sp.]|uniref:penicillin-binding protein 1C n=1 Tax=uncultured Litoreibacter sp. TaxID=1392394 RepID=UPI0026207356|nr:penicillin-binding protein 1C [uncultured Litoreibacter sp.]